MKTFVGRTKSIAGTALIGLGIYVFYESVHQAATQFSNLRGVFPREMFGVFPTVILLASRYLQAWGADYTRSLQGCVLHLLASSWPLLLVIAGTVLSRDSSTDSSIQKKDCGPVDLRAGHSTSD